MIELFFANKEKYYFCDIVLYNNQLKELRIMAYVIGEDCVACGTCAGECPVEAISEGDIYKIDPEACTECGTCADACPTGAISLGK